MWFIPFIPYFLIAPFLSFLSFFGSGTFFSAILTYISKSILVCILRILGFGELGPIQGSFATWWQRFYKSGVPAGSMFAYLQRLGMALFSTSFATWCQSFYVCRAAAAVFAFLQKLCLIFGFGPLVGWWNSFHVFGPGAGYFFAVLQKLVMAFAMW